MADTVRDVKVRLSTERVGNPARPFDELGQASKRAGEAVNKSMGSIVTDVRKADRGVLALSHGMTGLTIGLSAMSGTLAQSGGHMSKFADHATKAASAVMLFHSLALTVRGLVTVIGLASKAMAGYATATLAAAAANRVFAASAGAAGAASAIAGPGGTAGPFGSAVSVGGLALGGVAAGSLFSRVGLATTRYTGALSNAARGWWQGLGRGTLTGGLSGIRSFLNRTGFLGRTAAGAAGRGAAAVAANPLTWAITGGLTGAHYLDKWGLNPAGKGYGEPSRGLGEFVRLAELGLGWDPQSKHIAAEQRGLAKRDELDISRGHQLAIQSHFAEQQRQLGVQGAGLADVVPGMQFRAGAVTRFTGEATGRAGALIGGLAGAMPEYAKTPLGALHLAQEQEGLVRLGEHGAERRADAAGGVRSAQQEFKRAQQEQLEAAGRLHDLEKKGTQLTSERLHAQDQLRQATTREIEARVKVVDAMREQGKVTKETLQAEKQAVQEIIKQKQTLVAQEKERHRTLAEEYGLMSPEARQRVSDLAKRLKSQGLGGGRPAQWRMDNGRWVQTPGTGTAFDEETLAFMRGNPFLSEMTKKAAIERGESMPGFRQLMEATGQYGKMREAEAGLKVLVESKNAIEVKIDTNAKELEKELSDRIIPQLASLIKEANQNLKEELTTALNKAVLQQQQGARNLAGGQG